MKIKKSTKALAAAASLAMMATVGLSACGGGSNDAETTADGKVKITMWHGFSEADGKTLESIVDDFNKSQDKYEIDAQLQPWSTIGETMVTKVTSGDGPDFVNHRRRQRPRLVHRRHLPVRHRFLRRQGQRHR